MSPAGWFTVAGVLLVLALLAYKWEYQTTMWDRRQRRNRQLMLIALLLGLAVAALIQGASS